VAKAASSFSIQNGRPQEGATLVIDVRKAIPSPENGYSSNSKAKRAYIVRMGRVLLAEAEKHLATTPGGHVAFGCRLGQDRSPTMAAELNRRMAERGNA